MRAATKADAETVAKLLNLNKEIVWAIIGGKHFATHTELAMVVHHEFTLKPPTL
jgi:hypothetical protein